MQLGMGLHPCPMGNLQPCGDGPQICALNRFRHMSKKSPRTNPAGAQSYAYVGSVFVTEMDPKSVPRGDPNSCP